MLVTDAIGEALTGLVPDEARLRPYKSNFDPVIVAGMDADLPLVRALLEAPGAHIGAYVDRQALASHLASPPQPLPARRAWAMSLWYLATLEGWLRLQADEDVLPTNASANHLVLFPHHRPVEPPLPSVHEQRRSQIRAADGGGPWFPGRAHGST